MDALLQDLRYALRQLVRNRGFTIVAVLTLTLGIGANTAIFSVIRGVLLRPLPFPEPERLMLGVETIGQGRSGVTAPDFNDWRMTLTLSGHVPLSDHTLDQRDERRRR